MASPSAYSLIRLLEKEIALYQRYLDLLREERSFTTRFSSDKILALVEKRENVLIEMKIANEDRLALCKEFPHGDQQKLIPLIEKNFKGEERRKLLFLAQKLKAAAQYSQAKTREVGAITRFGLGIIEGLRSIFSSAARHVTKSYSRQGIVQENSTPAGTRDSSVLKKA